MNLFQDYLVNLLEATRGLPPGRFSDFGSIIRQDFTDFSGSLEKMAHLFFREDLERLALSDLHPWHKYPLKDTESRLRNTQLFKRRDEIEKLRAA